MVFLLSLPGGWLADRIIGQRRAVLFGGIIIALGNYALAIPSLTAFYTGLALIVLGTGLLKPNISTMVGALYTEKDVRRDAGFSIFYMGINVGAMIAPLVCGYLGENINWHYGFIAAGAGMTGGIIQYALGGKFLGSAGLNTSGTVHDFRVFRRVAIGVLLAVLLAAVLTLSGAVGFSAEKISDLSVSFWPQSASYFSPGCLAQRAIPRSKAALPGNSGAVHCLGCFLGRL